MEQKNVLAFRMFLSFIDVSGRNLIVLSIFGISGFGASTTLSDLQPPQ
ncbi:MAG: hypothetical protein ACOXZ9_02850 [Bacteroidales bacterium]